MKIQIAATDDEIASCFSTMLILRPHLVEGEFVARVKSMHGEGFLLAFLEDEGEVRAVAGYRMHDLLFSGRTLYVDDLVTVAGDRSKGYGSKLLRWLEEEAKKHRCTTFTLDSGVFRYDAHRFYFRERMAIFGYHFSKPVPGDDTLAP